MLLLHLRTAARGTSPIATGRSLMSVVRGTTDLGARGIVFEDF
jgi:hypothetical protein